MLKPSNPKSVVVMKLLLAVISILAVLPVVAADSQPFAPIPFQLELPRPAIPPIPISGLRLDLPVGPVRIDYGQPIPAGSAPRFNFNGDYPGPGYREQRARFLNK